MRVTGRIAMLCATVWLSASFAAAAAPPRVAPGEVEPARVCGFTSSTSTYTPRTAGFEGVRQRLNAALDRSQKAGLSSDMPTGAAFRVPADVEFLTIEVDRYACDGRDADADATASAKTGDVSVQGCIEVGCMHDFPGFDGPVGSTMTVSTCGGGVRTTTTYLRVDTGWMVINYVQERVRQCNGGMA